MVTPGHTMLVGRYREPLTWEAQKVEVLEGAYKWSFKTRNQPDVGGTPQQDRGFDFGVVSGDDLVELAGWFVAEGHYHSRGTAVCITQKKPDYVNTIAALCARLAVVGCPFWGPYIQSDGTHKFYLAHADLKAWLLSFCPKGSANTKLPLAYLTLPLGQATLLFETLMAGDGSWRDDGYGSYHSISRTLADQVHVLAVRLGYKACLFEQGTGWTVSVTSGCGRTTLMQANMTREPFTGKVWCFETDTGFFLTRRNGKVGYHGNTKYGDTLPYGYMIVDMGGQRSVWVRVEKKTMTALDLLGILCIDNKRTLDDVLGGVLQSIAKGELKELIDTIVKKTSAVVLPTNFQVSPTKDNLEKVASL
jgi:hypothetical protein